MTAKRHHYVPRCYLKGFARHRDKPKLFVVDGKRKSAFFTSTANVAAEQYFHRVEVEGHPPDALEKALSEFESNLAPALERIIVARSLKNSSDRAFLLNLIALVAVKNPRHRESFRKAYESTVKRVMDLATATPERWTSQMRRAQADGFVAKDANVDYAKMRAFVEADQYEIQTTTDFHLALELRSFNAILPYFFHRKWVLLRAPRGRTGFITSDHPACLMWSDAARRAKFHPPGHGLRKTQVVFPISNELAVIGAFEAQEDEMDANDLLIAHVNGAILEYAERQVYARDGEFIYMMEHNRRIMRGVELLKDDHTIGPRRRDVGDEAGRDRSS